MDLPIYAIFYNLVFYGAGVISTLAALYGYLKQKNKVIVPAEHVEDMSSKIEELSECTKIVTEVQSFVGKISMSELSDIICLAQEMSQGGFTAAEAQNIGMRIIKAVKEQ